MELRKSHLNFWNPNPIGFRREIAKIFKQWSLGKFDFREFSINFFLFLTESLDWWKLCVRNENLQWSNFSNKKWNQKEIEKWRQMSPCWNDFISAIKHREKVIYSGTRSEVKWEREVYEKQLNVYKVERQTRSSDGFASHHWICCWVIQIL